MGENLIRLFEIIYRSLPNLNTQGPGEKTKCLKQSKLNRHINR